MDFDWKSLIKTIAPGIASVFGTPLAGMGVSALLDAVLPEGEKRPTTQSDAEALLAKSLQTASPDLLLKIKEAENAFKLKAKELDIDLEKLAVESHKAEVADRDSARKYAAVDTEKVASKLTVFIAGAFSVTVVVVFIMAVLEPNSSPSPYIAGLVGTIVGAVISEFKQMTSFHFGRNIGSERTKEMLFKSTANSENDKH